MLPILGISYCDNQCIKRSILAASCNFQKENRADIVPFTPCQKGHVLCDKIVVQLLRVVLFHNGRLGNMNTLDVTWLKYYKDMGWNKYGD